MQASTFVDKRFSHTCSPSSVFNRKNDPRAFGSLPDAQLRVNYLSATCVHVASRVNGCPQERCMSSSLFLKTCLRSTSIPDQLID
jgi:hypothetical protein